MNSSAYSLPAPKLVAPIIRDDGIIQFTTGSVEQVDQWFLSEEKKSFGVKYTEVLTPEGDDVDYWDDLLSVLDNRELFLAGLRLLVCPLSGPIHFAFKGPLTKEQRHLIHKMNRKGEFKTRTVVENGVNILHLMVKL